jgi:hypothetical protein
MADAWKATGEWGKALAERKVQEEILTRMRKSQPDNIDTKEKWVNFQIAMADFYRRQNNHSAGQRELAKALSMLEEMIADDKENQEYTKRRRDLQRRITALEYIER